MAETIYKYLPFAYDELSTRRAKVYLEQKALEGYELVELKGIRGTLGSAKFKVIEPRKIVYDVKKLDKIKDSEYKASREAEGWEVVVERGAFKIFKWDRKDEPTLDSVNLESEKKRVLSSYIKTQGIMVFLAPLYLMLWNNTWKWNYEVLLSNMRLLMILIVPLYIVLVLTIIIRPMIYNVQISREIRGEKVCYTSMRRDVVVKRMVIISMIAAYLFALFTETSTIAGLGWVGVMTIMLSGSCYLGYVLNKVLKIEDKKKRYKKMGAVAVVTLVVIVGAPIMMIPLMAGTIGTMDKGEKDVTGYPVLSVSNLKDGERADYRIQRFRKKSSIFVPRQYDYVEYLVDGTDISTLYYKAISSKVAGVIYEGELAEHVERIKRYEEKESERLEFVEGDGSTSREIVYDKEDNKIFIRDDKKVVILEGNIDFTEEIYKEAIQGILE